MCNRIRTMSKHMADALNRRPPLPWAENILNGDRDDDGEDDDEDSGDDVGERRRANDISATRRTAALHFAAVIC